MVYKSIIGDDQNKVKRPLYRGFANTPVVCISVSVLRDLHWLPLVISRFASITIVYFTFPINRATMSAGFLSFVVSLAKM